MENILSFLKSHTEPWRRFGSTFLDIDPKLTLLSVLGLLLLYLCYLLLKPFLQPLWKTKNIPKHQDRAKRRRRRGFRGERYCQKDAAEGRKRLSSLQSLLDQHHDTTCIRQLLCPDPLCEVCNRATAQVSHLLSLPSVKDAAPTWSPLASMASVTESSSYLTSSASLVLPQGDQPSVPEPSSRPPSIFSPNQITHLEDVLSPSPPGSSLPPVPIPPLASKLPLDSLFPPPPPHHRQETERVFQRDAPLPLVGSPGGVSTNVPAPRGIDRSSSAVAGFSWRDPPVKNLFATSLAPYGVKEDFLPSSEASFRGDAAACLTEPSNLSFVSPDVVAFLERQIKKRGDFLMWKEKEKQIESFPKQLNPRYQLTSEGKMLQSLADPQDSAISLPFESSKGKSEELHAHLQPPYLKTFEEHLQQKCIQLLWGLPALHTKPLSPKVPDSGDGSSTIICFNTISDAPTAHESPVLPHPQPLSLPEIQLEPLTQTPSQSQSQYLPAAQSQARPESPIPVPPEAPVTKIEVCELIGKRPHCEAKPLLPSEIRHLEYNVLQKLQESMWGLPSAVQRSQEDFCPPAPSLSLVSQSSKAHAPVSISPGDFPLPCELRKKLEHHLRKRLILHRWGLPRRIHESLSLMRPQTGAPEASESKSSLGLSWISSFKHQSSQDLRNVALSQPRSFHERSSEERGGQERGHSDSQTSPDSSLGSDSEVDRESDLWSLSGKSSRTSVVSPWQKQLENALEVHLSKKFEEINECQLPGTVCSSWHPIKATLPVPEKCPSQMRQRDLAPQPPKDSCLNTPQDSSFLHSSKQKILEDHIKTFHRRMMLGLPHRVQGSLEIFNMKEDPSQSLSISNFPSSATLISGVDSNLGVSKPFTRNSNIHGGDKERTKHSVPILGHPLPAAAPVGKAGQGPLRQSPSAGQHEGVADLHRLKDGREPSPRQMHSIGDTASRPQAVAGNECSPKLPMQPAGAGPEPKEKGLSPSNSEQRPQGKNRDWRKFSMSNLSREIFKEEELGDLLSQPSATLTPSEVASSTVREGNMHRVKPTLTSGRLPTGAAAPHNPEASDLQTQLLDESRRKLESRKHSQAQGLPDHLPLATGSLTSTTFLTHGPSVSSGDVAASQVLHVHLDNTEASTEQGPQHHVPLPDSHKGQGKNFPPAAKPRSPRRLRTGELGGGDAGMGTSQPRRKSHPAQDRPVVGRHENQSFPVLSPKGQPRPESRFRNQMKHILQWLCHGTQRKEQEASLGKGSTASSSVQGRGLVTGTAAFSRDHKDQRVRMDTGKVIQEKLRSRHGVDKTCPQERLSVPRRPGKTQHKAEPQVQAEPVQGHPFTCKGPCSHMPSATSLSQEAVLALLQRQFRDGDGQPPKYVAFKGQRHRPSVSHVEPVPHPSPTSRLQVHQVSLAAPTVPERTVLGKFSLLFKEKILLQHFREEKFTPHK